MMQDVHVKFVGRTHNTKLFAFISEIIVGFCFKKKIGVLGVRL